MSSTSSTVKKTRRSAGHSKNGCLTCRVRRVKCDETKPQCRKCTDTGRKCEGPVVNGLHFVHEMLPGSSSTSSPSPERLPSLNSVDYEERHVFSYFLAKAAPCFAGHFDTSFWNCFIPQISYIDKSVWNITLAIGALFGPEALPFSWYPFHIATPQRNLRALKWYNTALSGFRSRLQEAPDDPSVAFLSCTLCICVESEQQHVSAAMSLTRHAIKMVAEVLRSKHAFNMCSPSTHAVIDAMVPFFSRHALVMCMFGQPAPIDWLQSTDLRLTHGKNLIGTRRNKARVSLLDLLYKSYEYVRILMVAKVEDEHKIDLLQKQQTLLNHFALWRLEWWETPNISSLLIAYYNVAVTWLSVCLDGVESSFDAHKQTFETIIDASTDLLNTSLSIELLDCDGSNDLSVIPPLLFVVLRCRHAVIRRTALDLLQKALLMTGKTSFWHAYPTLRVAEKVVELEEEHLLDRQSLPEEEYRINHIELVRLHGAGGGRTIALRTLRIVTIDMGMGRQTRNVEGKIFNL